MDIMDLDSFRSRYSDITVTAVPAKQPNDEANEDATEQTSAPLEEMAPLVEIIPITVTSNEATTSTALSQQQQRNKPTLQHHHKLSQDAVAYANEYKQVLAKLEYTKYVQAQLQLMSMSKSMSAPAFDSNRKNNIVETYDSLLSVIAEMQCNLAPTAIGLRAPKERLLRDIAQARVLVRECTLILISEQQQQQQQQWLPE